MMNKLSFASPALVAAVFSAGLASAPVTHAQGLDPVVLAEDLLFDLLNNFITLEVNTGVEFGSQTMDPEAELGLSVYLQSPDISALGHAASTSANSGYRIQLLDGGPIRAGVSAGKRGSLDFSAGFFEGGLEADNGVFGYTPTLGGYTWVGNDRLGVLLESEIGVAGPLEGWLGSATLSYNIVDETVTPFDIRRTGLNEVVVSASVSAMDENYAGDHFGVEIDNAPIGLHSYSLGLLSAFDLGGGWRLSVPVEFSQLIGPAGAASDSNNDFNASIGLALGYRF